MSKTEEYNKIVKENIPFFSYYIYDDDKKAEEEAIRHIQKFTQIIERLRSIVDDGKPPEEIHSLLDVRKLSKDELAYVAHQFWKNTINGDSDCPAEFCGDFPCRYRQKIKHNCEEYLKKGLLTEDGLKGLQKNGYCAEYCDDDGEGCWGDYYLWCYRNGYDPDTGKKEQK